jgi:pyrimidine-nucleoside phosphorylase
VPSEQAASPPGPVHDAAPGRRAQALIERKRDGGELAEDELRWLVDRYVATLGEPSPDVSEGQMAAFLMAGVIRGFTIDEAAALTRIFVDSGDVLDLSGMSGATIDKHSTGGVGDGTTLLVAPLLAAAGARLVKISGRGLGHTGGTLDKLESIPGMRVQLGPEEMRDIADRVGCVVAAQTARLVPADGALYALRDVTGTTASTALIASSVMSKKIASGAESIVLDVKAGNGAFMATAEEAGLLAGLCVRLAAAAGRRCAALVTAMDVPLGNGIGNALEVAECVTLLQRSPEGRLAELSLDLAAVGLTLSRGGDPSDSAQARAELRRLWEQGAALDRLRAMVAAQGGDPSVCDDPWAVLPRAPVHREVPAARDGYVAGLQARAVGEVSGDLGAGRARKSDPVDPAVGLDLHVAVGDRVEAGQDLVTVHARTEEDARRAEERVRTLLTLAEDPVGPAPTLLDLVS